MTVLGICSRHLLFSFSMVVKHGTVGSTIGRQSGSETCLLFPWNLFHHAHNYERHKHVNFLIMGVTNAESNIFEVYIT